MPPVLILEIVKLSLEIALQVLKDMPPEQKVAAWERHAKAMAFWENVFERFAPQGEIKK